MICFERKPSRGDHSHRPVGLADQLIYFLGAKLELLISRTHTPSTDISTGFVVKTAFETHCENQRLEPVNKYSDHTAGCVNTETFRDEPIPEYLAHRKLEPH